MCRLPNEVRALRALHRSRCLGRDYDRKRPNVPLRVAGKALRTTGLTCDTKAERELIERPIRWF